jgi:secondary thiamine-phosphate synthase enzyme
MAYIVIKELTTSRNGMHDVTGEVREILKKSGVRNGTLTVEAEGPACGVLRLCGEAGADLVKQTRDLVPARVNFACQAPPEETAGLLKSALFGSSLSLIVKDGEILFGGKILFAEYDGPRDRRYAVCVQGEV